MLLTLRKDDLLLWRDGKLLFDGETIQLFTQRVTNGAANFGLVELSDLKVVSGADGVLAISQFAFDTSDWAFGSFTFQVIMSVSVGTLTGQVLLYNLTDAETVFNSTLTTSSTTPVKLTGSLTAGSSAGYLKDTEKIYEIRIQNDGSLPSELAYLGSALLKVTP
jgi:hypothetical protein